MTGLADRNGGVAERYEYGAWRFMMDYGGMNGGLRGITVFIMFWGGLNFFIDFWALVVIL